MEENSVVNFCGDISVVKPKQLFELGISKSAFEEAKANTLVPASFDTERNFDVLPVVFSLAVVNQFNLNGDGMNAETAIDALPHFKNKPINIEHKKDQIVGHIINASFSRNEPEFHENDIEDFRGSDEPFYITAAGLIYSQVFPELAEALIEASKPEDETYKSISTSWEVAFTSFDLMEGTDKNFSNGRILSDDEKQEELMNLSAFGGSGKSKNGKPLMRILNSPAYPLGAALTLSPAARVSGVFVDKGLLSLSENAKTQKDDSVSKNDKNDKKEPISTKNSNKTSHLNKNSVRTVKSHIMDNEQFQQLLATVAEILKDSFKGSDKELSEANQQSLVGRITEALDKRSKEWEAEKEKAAEAVAAKDAELAQAREELDTVKNDLTTTKDELKTIKDQVEAQERNARFQNRMKLVEDKFDLSDEEGKIVASEVKTLGDSDEDFDAYVNKLNIIFAHKSKDNQEDNESNASDKTDKVDLDTSKASNNLPNSNKSQATEKSLFERVKANLSVKYTK